MTSTAATVSTLHLSTPLRRFAQDAASVPASGATLAELLEDAGRRYPALPAAIIDDGQLVPFVTALIGGAGTGEAASLTTPVPPGSSVRLLCAVAGG